MGAAVLVLATCDERGRAPAEEVFLTVVLSRSAIPVGTTEQLEAVVRDASGHRLPNRPVTWRSLHPEVAVVDDAGIVTAVAPGSAAITATVGARSAEVSLEVVPLAVVSVVVTPATATLEVGGATDLSVAALDESGKPLTGRAVGWSSSAIAVATVSPSGRVSALSPGEADISATSERKTGSMRLIVSPIDVAAVNVAPTTASIHLGESGQLWASPLDASGNQLAGRVITWTSSAPAIAAVSPTGLVTAVAVGDATITATCEGKSGSARVDVTPVPAPIALTIAPAAPWVTLGGGVTLAAVVTDAKGRTVPDARATWSVANGSVASIDQSARVRGVRAGRTTVRAQVNGVSGSATLSVLDAYPFFRSPFAGDFPLTNFFDHNRPTYQITDGVQTTWWGEQASGVDGHGGTDWALPLESPVLAMADGEVTLAGVGLAFCDPSQPNTDPLVVEILHALPNGERLRTQVRHLSHIGVRVGQRVRAGEQIALSGRSGCFTYPHLHMSVWRLAFPNDETGVILDPEGWSGAGSDPWAASPDGVASVALWIESAAPPMFREQRTSPNPTPADRAPVAVVAVRWMGVRDDEHPNNEFVEIAVDPRYTGDSTVDLSGYELRNRAGDMFRFPSGFRISAGSQVRVYTGSGSNTKTRLYWGLGSGVWSNIADAAELTGAGSRSVLRYDAHEF